MEFSDVHFYVGQCRSSPDGRYIAHYEDRRIIIRHTSTLQLHTTLTAADPVQSLQWSPDSNYLIAVLHSSHDVQVFSPDSPSVVCRVGDQRSIKTAAFAPDSRHLLTTSTFSGLATLYSLTSSHRYVINKLTGSSLARFSPDAAMLATVERHDDHDHLGLYSLHTHQPLYHIQLPTDDTARIDWSPDSSHILCIDSPMYGNTCCVRAVDGRVVVSWQTGERHDFERNVKCGVWSGCGRWLAIGRWDESVEVWHVRTWKRVLQWRAPERVSRAVVVYEEKLTGEAVHEAISEQKDDDALHLDDLGADDKPTRTGRHQRKAAHNSSAPPQSGPMVKANQTANGSRVSSSHPPASSNQSTATESTLRGTATSTSTVKQSSQQASHYCVARSPFTLPCPAEPPLVFGYARRLLPVERTGVSLLSFPADGSYVSFRLESKPCCIFLLSLASLSLHSVLVQLQPVVDARWQQEGVRRLLLCGGGKLYGWAEAGCSVTSVPHAGFAVERLEVCGSGRSKAAVLLLDKERFCCVYQA